MASSEPTPTHGAPSARDSPRAKATPTRMPAKEPGPTVTPMRSIRERSSPASARTAATMVGNCSAWPRPMSGLAEARMRSVSASYSAAAQKPGGTIKRERQHRAHPTEKAARGRAASTACIAGIIRPGKGRPGSDGFDFTDFRHEMAKQVLDAVLERGRGRGATGAGALHVQEHLCRRGTRGR